MNEKLKASKLHLHNVGRMLIPLFVWFMRLVSEIGNFASVTISKALKKRLLLHLNQTKVRHFIEIMEGNQSAIKRFRWIILPKSWVKLQCDELVNVAFERLDLSKNDKSKTFQSEIVSKTALLIALRMLGIILETKERHSFERHLSEIAMKVLRRFNLNIDDPNLYQNLKRQIVTIERDLDRIVKIAEAEKQRMLLETQKEQSTPTEAIMGLLHIITNTVNRDMYLIDFFVIYQNHKKQIQHEKQNSRNI